MRANFFNGIAVALSLTAAVPALASQAPVPTTAEAPAAPAADTTVVAKVTLDGKTIEITLGQLKDRLKLLPPQLQGAPFEKIYDMLLAAQIDMMIVTDAAKKDAYDKKPEVISRMSAAQEAVLQKSYLDDKIKGLATDADLKTLYDQVIKSLPPVEEARIRQITFGDEKKAKEALAELKKGTSFENVLAEAQKKDSNVKGGDMNYVRIDDLPPAMSEKVKKAAKATIVSDVIKTELGYHVVRVDDKRPHPVPTFDEAKPELLNLNAPKYVQQVVEGMRKNVKIEKFTMDGKPAPEAAPAAAAPAADQAAPATAAPAAPAA